LIFCVLLLIVLWLFQIVFLDAFYIRIKTAEIRRNASIIINNIESENISEIITEISNNNDITINITNLSGRNLLRTSQPDNRRWSEENAALIARAKNNGGEIHEYITAQPGERPRNNMEADRTTGGRTGYDRQANDRAAARRRPVQSLIYVKTANNGRNEQYAVIIRAVISPVSATVTTLRYQLYYISCIIIFLSVILAVIIAKIISKPIEEINKSAGILAKGNYDTRFNGKGFYEIVALSETLNTTAVELGRVERGLKACAANCWPTYRTICGRRSR